MAQNKHLSYNDIPDLNADWGKDVTNENKPYAGQSVQKFLKQQVAKSYGYSRTASGYMQFFRTPEDADAYDAGDTTKLLSQVSMQGVNVEFRFVNQYSGNVFINGNNAFLFPVTVRSMDINSDGTETPHDSNISLAIMVNLNNGTTTTDLGTFPANEEFTVNITPYVADGATFVFVASDDDGNRRTSSRYSVVRANLSLAQQNNTWWATAYRQGDTAWNVPLSLDVNVPAELTATIRKDNVNYVTKTVPSSMFSTNYALYIDHPMANGGASGTYELHLELRATDESLASLPVETLDVNIFCVAENSSDLLLITNNVATELQNYVNNRVLDYAVFAGSGNHTLTIEAKEGATDITSPQTVSAQNGEVGTYYLNMEMERIDDSDYTVRITAHFDDSVVNVFDSNFTATNRLGYAATAGATMLIKANGRSNDEANREKLYNILNGDIISPVWENVTWSSVDGYRQRTMLDTAGKSIDVAFIRLLSGQTMTLPVTPLKMSAAQGRTLEIMFQPRNIMNYDTPVIKCLDNDNEGDGFNGLKVTSSRITLMTAASRNDDTQSKNFDPEDIIHLTIVINPSYSEAGTAFRACFIYINGVKQRVFTYNRDLNVASNLIFGSADADLDIYAVRTYNTALTSDEVVTNAVNWCFSLNDKEAMRTKNNIKENGRVDFNKVRSLCNVFVFKADNGSGDIPTLGWGKKDTISGELRTYWRDTPAWNKTVQCDLAGQGTSSMEYFRWNFKTSFSTALDFDGGTHPAIKKLCAKKNFASSMQSHKMGGTEAYDYLARATGAVGQDAARQAIWQYPFVGFTEDGQGNLTFVGLYTVGPDKGDKDTFGFGSDSIAMEGLDNDRMSTNFRVPWNDSTVEVDAENEKYTVCGEKAWEDSRKNAAGVLARWKPAYNLVYECSQLIRPWKGTTVSGTTYAATLEGLLQYATAISAIDTSTDEGKEAYKAAVMYEYWISGSYDLYRYDQPSGEYVQSYTTAAINLSDELCGKGYVVGQQQSGGVTTDILLTTTLLQQAADDDARNELFKKARVSKFRKEIGQHFNVTNSLFHLAWVEFNAATDNLAKNTYPYLLDATDPDSRWCWRQDDVDTVLTIENQGKDKKPYCVELEDNYSDYGLASLWVWNGRYSQFWFTLKEAFATEYADFVRTRFFQAMHYGSASNVMQRIMDFFQHFYFNRAQKYFGAALYNADGIYCYEQAYLYTGTYTHKGIALEQLLGDHYSAEKYWVRMRTIYMMSKYCADLFSAGQAVDCFATRVGEGVNTYTITPAIYMYPVVQNGEQALQGPRFWPGSNITQWSAGPITTAGDQTFRINGMSYIRSVGNLYQNTLKESVSVAGQMLRTLNLGSRTADPADIKSTVTAIAIDNATSLRSLDMAQLATLQGSVNLSACANLREVYAGDTALASVTLSDGGPLTTLVLGDNITTLQLLGKQMLQTLTIGSTDRLTGIEMRNCNDYTVGRVMSILGSIQIAQVTSVRLGFGTASAPSVITDNDIQTLLTLNAATIETKQFSGYITKAIGRILGSVKDALDSMNITYVGEVQPEITISSDDVTITGDACTMFSGDTVTFRGNVHPSGAATPHFHLYNGSQLITEDAEGKATYNGATLDCNTGVLVTTAVNAAFTVGVTAYIDGMETNKVSVTIDKTVLLGGFSISGTKSYTQTSDYTLTLVPTNSDYTVPVTDIAVTFNGDDCLAVSVPSQNELRIRVSCSALPQATTQYALGVTLTDAKGNTYTQQDTLTIQIVPVTSFEISGNSRIRATGTYAYTLANILPANANKGITAIAVNAGSYPVTVNGTTGFSITVAEMTETAVTQTITVTASIDGGGQVTATKSITIMQGNDPELVDLGLPSGTLWADRNIGAASETDYGLYFAWGETTGYADATARNTALGRSDGFSNGAYTATGASAISGNLALSEDAAHVILGGDWRMPTKEETKELNDNCRSEWVIVNKVKGKRFTSKVNGNSVFFPASGMLDGTELRDSSMNGYYWSASFNSASLAYTLYFKSGGVTPQQTLSRRLGFPLRAVQ